MIAVRRKRDNVIIYLLEDGFRTDITDVGLRHGSFKAKDINTNEHELVKGVPAPEDTFRGGEMTYDGNNWAIVDEQRYTNSLPVPASVTRLQARIALVRANKWKAVINRVNNLPDTPENEEVKAFFEDSTVWHRDNPIVAQFAAALNLSDDALDNLFRQASKVK